MLRHVHCMKRHRPRPRSSLEILGRVVNVDYSVTMSHLVVNVPDPSRRSDILPPVLDEEHLQRVVDRGPRIYQGSGGLRSAWSFYLQVSVNPHLAEVRRKLLDVEPHKPKRRWLI